MSVTVEVQNDKNNVVLDALSSLFDRQEKFEKSVDQRVKQIEDIIKEV
jgi:hypothetical protein